MSTSTSSTLAAQIQKNPTAAPTSQHLTPQQATSTAPAATNAAAAAIAAAATAATAPAARTMQSDEDFNIRFVNLVRAHKCLYDKKVPEYRNRDNQEKAWSLISQETRESVIHCKERWRNLRACLSRYIKQQSGSDPQHKPYYLTEHMSFLLPFLKSSRNPIDASQTSSLSDSLAASLFTQHAVATTTTATAAALLHQTPFLPYIVGAQHHNGVQPASKLEIKHSLSENDEETIDAFDPAIVGASPPLSDTASANTLQNFIPDVQISELSTPDPVVTCPSVSYAAAASSQTHSSGGGVNAVVSDFASEPKRIKTEVTTSGQMHLFSEENTDMEFFRSILPDIATLTPQQKRKFKIGVLECIDDVVEKYPQPTTDNRTTSIARQRHISGRDWRQ